MFGPDLQQQSTSRTLVPCSDGPLEDSCSLLASPHVLVAQLGRLGIWMWRLDGPNTIGALLCAVPGLTGATLRPRGHFLAGFMGRDVCVLHGRTGACLMRLAPAQWWPCLQDVLHPGLHIVWGGKRHDQLLLTAKMGPSETSRAQSGSCRGYGVLFLALAF